MVEIRTSSQTTIEIPDDLDIEAKIRHVLRQLDTLKAKGLLPRSYEAVNIDEPDPQQKVTIEKTVRTWFISQVIRPRNVSTEVDSLAKLAARAGARVDDTDDKIEDSKGQTKAALLATAEIDPQKK